VPRYVRVDAPKLRQILINLLGNAIKFTREGTVKLQLSAKPTDEPGRARLCFAIEDSGVGMAQHDLGRIFEPFEQVGNPSQQTGTGLGLTITRRFVELMGGTLMVQSRVGQGSRFVVELPLELALASETYGVEQVTRHPFILESSQQEWRVLIVEDDLESATVLRKMLTRAGFQVRVAENGAIGIEVFQQWRPHFIWMDLDLAQLSGTEATRQIRRLDGGADVKIAAITAAADASERDGLMQAGLDDFTSKPFRQTEVFLCMARHLSVRYSSSEGAGNKSHRQAGVVRRDVWAALHLPPPMYPPPRDPSPSPNTSRLLPSMPRSVIKRFDPGRINVPTSRVAPERPVKTSSCTLEPRLEERFVCAVPEAVTYRHTCEIPTMAFPL
jgi:CheY-like chemotaxis protein